MQSDAFPTPSIYSHQFQPRLEMHHAQQWQDCDRKDYLVSEISLLLTDCLPEESSSFWRAANRLNAKNRSQTH